MKNKFLQIHEKIKVWVTQVLLKKIVTPIALVLVYIFVLGPTSIVAKVFFRRALTKSSQRAGTNWVAAENFESTLEGSRTQS